MLRGTPTHEDLWSSSPLPDIRHVNHDNFSLTRLVTVRRQPSKIVVVGLSYVQNLLDSEKRGFGEVGLRKTSSRRETTPMLDNV